MATIPFTLLGCAIVPAPNGATVGHLDVEREVMLMSGDNSTELHSVAVKSVRKLLTLQGYRIVEQAQVAVVVGLGDRVPDIEFEVGNAAGAANQTASEPAENSRLRLHFCAARAYRLTVAFVDQRASTIAYRGFAETESCKQPDQNEIYNLAASALRSLRADN